MNWKCLTWNSFLWKCSYKDQCSPIIISKDQYRYLVISFMFSQDCPTNIICCYLCTVHFCKVLTNKIFINYSIGNSCLLYVPILSSITHNAKILSIILIFLLYIKQGERTLMIHRIIDNYRPWCKNIDLMF